MAASHPIAITVETRTGGADVVVVPESGEEAKGKTMGHPKPRFNHVSRDGQHEVRVAVNGRTLSVRKRLSKNHYFYFSI